MSDVQREDVQVEWPAPEDYEAWYKSRTTKPDDLVRELLAQVGDLIEQNDVPGSTWHLPRGTRRRLLQTHKALTVVFGRHLSEGQ